MGGLFETDILRSGNHFWCTWHTSSLKHATSSQLRWPNSLLEYVNKDDNPALFWNDLELLYRLIIVSVRKWPTARDLDGIRLICWLELRLRQKSMDHAYRISSHRQRLRIYQKWWKGAARVLLCYTQPFFRQSRSNYQKGEKGDALYRVHGSR